jgi:hypothetical protein
MTSDPLLLTKRKELDHQLATGAYQTLVDLVLDTTGRLTQKLTRNPKPLPFWYSALLITLVTLLVGLFLKALLAGELALRSARLVFSIVCLLPVTYIAYRIQARFFFTTLRNDILNSIESVADLTDLQHWLTLVSSKKKALLFALALGIVAGLATPILLPIAALNEGVVDVGLILIVAIINTQMGMGVYYLLLFFTLPARLSRYQFRLYAADPSSSAVIGHLSGLLMQGVYVWAMLVASITLVLTLLESLISSTVSAIVLTVANWGLLVILFVIIQVALARIITRAKWKTLNAIQSQIERLRSQEEILSEKTLTHLGKLMDYHDRVKATRNSVLDLRASLSFINSLLLPLLAFLLANLGEIMTFFR